MKIFRTAASGVCLLCFCPAVLAGPGADLSALAADRAAIERIYRQHRNEAPSPAGPLQMQPVIAAEAHKEAVLKRVYGLEITPALIQAELQRLRDRLAPKTLAEIQHALGDDPGRFARSMARPLAVERLLRKCFEMDEKLHVPQHQAMDALRSELLATQSDPAPEGARGPVKTFAVAMDEITWMLTSRSRGEAHAFYFEDLPGKLRNALRVQLCKPGDVSEVIEMPEGFAVYLAKEKTASQLVAAVFSLPKISYEDWLANQPQ
ncbi:MAG: hypothetical protein NTZ46_10920 [Verrucomicrobia bacterium]|nr:hypothetical protein [Verrucomicrobiota bacterium]